MIFYILIVMIVMMLLNIFLFPRMLSPQVEEVDYGQFLQMAENGELSEVQVTDTEIVFADNSDPVNYYTTGRMEDPFLVDRLKNASRNFAGKSPGSGP